MYVYVTRTCPPHRSIISRRISDRYYRRYYSTAARPALSPQFVHTSTSLLLNRFRPLNENAIRDSSPSLPLANYERARSRFVHDVARSCQPILDTMPIVQP